MSVSVKVKRTSRVTVEMDEPEAAALAALVGNVGGDPDADRSTYLVKACQSIYSQMLEAGLTPPRFADCYVLRRNGIFVKGTAPMCKHGYTGSPAEACKDCLPA